MKTMLSVRDAPVRGKRVLVRVDFNVPLRNGRVADVNRIASSLPTIRLLLRRKAKVILLSHLGRPDGRRDPRASLRPVARALQKMLPRVKVSFFPACVGKAAEAFVGRMKPGELVLLENVRFHAEEERNDARFAARLARFADWYVNDAFAASHRSHASLDAITRLLPGAAGLLLEKEVRLLSTILKPRRPFVCIFGGAKISDKIGTMEHLARKADVLLIGGALAATFLRASGVEVGRSMADSVAVAERILKRYRRKTVLPSDVVVASSAKGMGSVISVDAIPLQGMVMDIGPAAVKRFCRELASARTVFWNGPLGVCEFARFARATRAVARFLARAHARTIIGGGDSAEAVLRLGLASRFIHISTGGGASLEFLAGKVMPALAALERNYARFTKRG